MKTLKQTQKEWDEKFNGKYKEVWNSKHSSFIRIPDGIKNNMVKDLHQRDQAIKQAVIREIKEIPKDKPKLGSENQELYVSYSNGYNQAIKDILTHLNNKE